MQISLIPFTADDYADYARVLQNPHVMENITGCAIAESEIQRAFGAVLNANQASQTFGFFRILVEGEYAGYAKFKRETADSVELGYFLLPEFWGKGIAFHVSQQLIARLADQPQIQRLIATINPANLRSKRLLQKLGFVYHSAIELDNDLGECWHKPDFRS